MASGAANLSSAALMKRLSSLTRLTWRATKAHEKLHEEVTLAQIDDADSIEELDIKGILAFAERVLPRASDRSVEAVPPRPSSITVWVKSLRASKSVILRWAKVGDPNVRQLEPNSRIAQAA
jgi:hypothetical protein